MQAGLRYYSNRALGDALFLFSVDSDAWTRTRAQTDSDHSEFFFDCETPIKLKRDCPGPLPSYLLEKNGHPDSE